MLRALAARLESLPGRLVLAVLFLVGVAADGDDADRRAGSVGDHDRLVLLWHRNERVGGGRGSAKWAAPNQRVHLGWHHLQGHTGPAGSHGDEQKCRSVAKSEWIPQ